MHCPLCILELKMSIQNDIELYICPKCRGVWIDRKEVIKMIEHSISKQNDKNKPDLSKELNDHSPRQSYHGYPHGRRFAKTRIKSINSEM